MVLTAALPISEYAKSVIQLIGVGVGLFMLAGFVSIMYETWKRPVSKFPVMAALAGLGAEVLALAYFPDYVFLVLPFTFAGSAWYLWVSNRFIQRSVAAGVDLGYPAQETPFISPIGKWILITVLVVAVTAGVNRNAKTITQTTTQLVQAERQNVNEKKALRKEVNAVKSDVKTVQRTVVTEAETSRIVRGKIIRSLDQNNKKVDALENRVTGRRPTRRPVDIVTVQPMQPKREVKSSLPTTLPQRKSEQKTEPKPTKKPLFDFWPFSYRNEGGYFYRDAGPLIPGDTTSFYLYATPE